MERTILLEHLLRTEEHIAKGERHLTRQREIIQQLERDGHDASTARDFLTTLEQTQDLHVANRERVRAELAQE
jgi:hypothetical protein